MVPNKLCDTCGCMVGGVAVRAESLFGLTGEMLGEEGGVGVTE